MLKIISCAGFGNTGSSVITDFFSEFSSIKVLGSSDFEFTFLHECDGIRDLEYALTQGHRLNVDLALKRFIKLAENLNYHNPSGPNYKNFFNGHFLEYTIDYIESLGVIKWKNGWWHRIFEVTETNKNDLLIKRKKFDLELNKSIYGLYETNSWRPSYTGFTDEYYCIVNKSVFKEKTKKYLERLFLELANDNEYVLFDQLFPTNVDREYLDYFDFAKVILVDRDPRDLYFMNKVFWGSGYIPTENVNIYIEWYKRTRLNTVISQNILHIKFEDMIYNFENTKKILCNFIGIDTNLHDKPRTHLFLEKSINNTQVYKRFELSNDFYHKLLNDDINRIEKELNRFLFDFPNSEYEFTKKQQITVIEEIYKKVNEKQFIDNFIKINVYFKLFFKKVIMKIKFFFNVDD